MQPVITINPKILNGTPCFAGTRVPAILLFDWLEDGYSVEQFLEQFPSVTREQVNAYLELMRADVARFAVPA